MPVLFSLIQQLAVDIGSKTELKIQYLEGALLAIRFDDLEPSSFKFLRTVLGDVTKVLNKFLLANPDHAMYRSIRMIAQYAALQLGQITAM
jgi:enhancer of mRNA-decapping protein 4